MNSSSPRRPSIFEMLHFGIPREPQFTGHVTMWRMPVSAEEEEEAEEKRRRLLATRTSTTLSSLPSRRFNRYNTDSEINGCSGEFCEILGPGCCSSCIETTNRSIAEEIQRRLFPEIEVSRRCLVKPKLTKVMKDGHLKQVRRKRLNELRKPQTSTGTAITMVTQKNATEPSHTATATATAAIALPSGKQSSRREDSMKLPSIGVPQPTFTPFSRESGKSLDDDTEL